MAASLVFPSSPNSPTGSDPNTESKLSMEPSTVASVASSPSKSGSVAVPKKEQEKAKAEVEEAAEAPIQEPVINNRLRNRNPIPKPKPKKKETALCVGYYVDALDKKMMWGEARIIQCNLKAQRIKVHFVGWSNNHDRWTDAKSIMAHGRHAPRTKDSTVKSWDGDMHLFEDMLGTIDEAALTPAPVPKENEDLVALSSTLAKKKADEMTKAPSVSRTGHTARSVLKRKADAGSSQKKNISKRIATTPKVVESNGNPQEHDQKKKHAVAVAKAKLKHAVAVTKAKVKAKVKAKEKTKEKRKPMQNAKKQKREGQQSTVSTKAKARPSTKNKAVSPDELPLFRNLELDDGTVMDFSVQRDKARLERDAMRSFLDMCALVWKDQLSAKSVK